MRATFEVDLARAEDGVRANVHRALTQGQFDALVSMTFNAGAGVHQHRHGRIIATGAQPVFDAINRDGPEAAGQVILTTAVHANGRLSRGLQNRRHHELAIYEGRAQ